MNQNLEIVFFDMDFTVLNNDCDILWKIFLSDQKIAPEIDREKVKHYMELYHQGELPINEFIKFQLKEFVGNTPDEMKILAQKHFQTKVKKHIFPQAKQEIEQYRKQKIPIVLLTGTNRVVSEPIANALGFTDLIATELEIINNRYTGGIVGRFLIKENKTILAAEFCRTKGTTLNCAGFYADSINDVELLKMVAQPVVVNPRQNLLAVAKANNWRIVNWSI